MTKRIGCLHAHYSNIEYMEQAFAEYDVEFVHFVDPALVIRVSSDEHFSMENAQDQVLRQVEWIAGSKVDAILITCTNYIALLQEDRLSTSIPIIKIDEPFFSYLCAQEQPQILLFTNPATVEGTMNRLNRFAHAHGKSPQIEVQMIEDAFSLLMQGKKEVYLNVLSRYMKGLIESESNGNEAVAVAVAQLSMVEAARTIYKETKVRIGNPLEPLVAYMEENLHLSYRQKMA
ncbi:hypothetical protein [Paenibacillus sp. NFR01]|uniref:hypothetical protein n=1 Tax=Paenibacillus sp. NFR01 TaxID=1566279 RepID=UPI0008D6873E|nr:hypothetical protein [Paenibacillus sp. NFR01]SET67625.1 hypothetical protein SAMN03159358_2369 [Paenibacillus sp. NFR01]